jgi:nitroreductase
LRKQKDTAQTERLAMLDKPDASQHRMADIGEAKTVGNKLAGSELLELLQRRRSVKPFQLAAPGPNADEIQKLLTVALRVPDHGGLEPWRVVVVQTPVRDSLVARLSAASRAANTHDPAGAEVAVKKVANLFSAPLTCIVVSRTDPAARIPEWEQVLSAGAVCMNLINAASALGFGATWLTGWTAYNAEAAVILGLKPGEKIAGIIPIGTVSETPPDRQRPSLQARVSTWEPDLGTGMN